MKAFLTFFLSGWCAVMLIGAAGCDLNPEGEIRNNLAAGEEALKLHYPQEAEKYYRKVLELDPMNAAAYRGMALVSDIYLQNNSNARLYYLRYLDCAEDKEAGINERLTNIENILNGKLEDPKNAWRDILSAIGEETPDILARRLSPGLVYRLTKENKKPEKFLAELKGMFRLQAPKVTYRMLHNNAKKATLLVQTAERFYVISLSIAAESAGIWRLEEIRKN